MNKNLAFIILVLILIVGISLVSSWDVRRIPAAAILFCRDSDVTEDFPDGINPFVRGTVTSWNGTGQYPHESSDYCWYSGDYLTEIYCDGRDPDSFVINCSDFGPNHACVDDACVNLIELK